LGLGGAWWITYRDQATKPFLRLDLVAILANFLFLAPRIMYFEAEARSDGD
jgi:hypothetical protein